MKRSLVLFLIIGMSSLAACAVTRQAAPSPRVMELPAATEAPAQPPAYGGVAPQESFASADALKAVGQNPASAANAERLVVKNADLTIVVADVPARVQAIQDMAKAMGGFIVSAN